jgi:hypothetical protein
VVTSWRRPEFNFVKEGMNILNAYPLTLALEEDVPGWTNVPKEQP